MFFSRHREVNHLCPFRISQWILTVPHIAFFCHRPSQQVFQMKSFSSIPAQIALVVLSSSEQPSDLCPTCSCVAIYVPSPTAKLHFCSPSEIFIWEGSRVFSTCCLPNKVTNCQVSGVRAWAHEPFKIKSRVIKVLQTRLTCFILQGYPLSLQPYNVEGEEQLDPR